MAIIVIIENVFTRADLPLQETSEERLERVATVRVQRESILFSEPQRHSRDVDTRQQVVVDDCPVGRVQSQGHGDIRLETEIEPDLPAQSAT